MANIEPALRQTLINEGGYSNDPQDRGGETFMGIARNMHPEWSGWPIIDKIVDKKNLKAFDPRLMPYVASFYKATYWDKVCGDMMADQNVANELFDTAVNCGIGFESKNIQIALNLLNRNGKSWPDIVVDGAIGPKTLATLNTCLIKDARVFYNLLNALQGKRYIEICIGNPTQEIYLRGWLERVDILKKS